MNRLTALLSAAALCATAQFARADKAGPEWQITGDLSEACSCSVPCACNFGAQPSPHAFCYALFSLDIKQGHYGDVNLDGLRLAGANGQKGIVWYIDSRATKEQVAAFKAMGQTMYMKALAANGVKDPKKAPPEFHFLGYKTAKLDQIVTDKKNYLKIGTIGSFSSDYIMGMDGKTPVKVENNWSWNISDGIKGKTKNLTYHDSYGNSYDFKQTNANQGKFDWSDKTPIYFR